jgi:hypothetical protein
MTPAARIAALVTAVLLVVTAVVLTMALALSGHLNSESAPIVVNVVGFAVTSASALLAAAIAHSAASDIATIKKQTNGALGAAVDALGQVATANPDRRSSDLAGAAAETASQALEPPPPPAPPAAP